MWFSLARFWNTKSFGLLTTGRSQLDAGYLLGVTSLNLSMVVPVVVLQLLARHCWWSGPKLQLRHNLRRGCLSAFTWFQTNRYVEDNRTARHALPMLMQAEHGVDWSRARGPVHQSLLEAHQSAPPRCLTKHFTADVQMLDVILSPPKPPHSWYVTLPPPFRARHWKGLISLAWTISPLTFAACTG